jgi:membrane protease YdiL (CAAX protease family)
MSELENPNSAAQVSPQPPRTWDFMETTFVALIAYAVFALASGLTLSALLATQDGTSTMSAAQLRVLWEQGHWFGAALIVACPPTVAVLWIAIRIARREFADYLALNWPTAGELVRALAVMTVLLLVETVSMAVFGGQGASLEPYLSARKAGGLLVYLVGACIAAPVMEEFVVRGFMFRGWSQSFLGPVGAIVLTSTLWAMIHVQYDWSGRFWIFVTGLMLCHLRWRSNSTWLPVMVHSAINIVIHFMIGLFYV